jgi:L-amino acid N-acyltransferase YncA
MVPVFDNREACRDFVTARVGPVIGANDWYQGIGGMRGGELVVAVLYTLMSEVDIVMHVAAERGKLWATRDFLRVAFRYPFVQLGLRRVSAFVPSTNRAALRLNTHLGFMVEGVMRDADPGGHVIVMGMRRSECRFLGEVDGQKASQRAAAA